MLQLRVRQSTLVFMALLVSFTGCSWRSGLPNDRIYVIKTIGECKAQYNQCRDNVIKVDNQNRKKIIKDSSSILGTLMLNPYATKIK
jgi:hypothetical protein